MRQSHFRVHNLQYLVRYLSVILLVNDPSAEVVRLNLAPRDNPPETAVVLRQNVMATTEVENFFLRKIDIEDRFDTMRGVRHSYVPF